MNEDKQQLYESDNTKTFVLSAKDVASFLQSIARVMDTSIVDKHELATAIFHLAKVLNIYGNEPANTVISSFTNKTIKKSIRKTKRVHSPFQTMNMSIIELKVVRDILNDERLTKQDLVRIGVERFGISKSRLERQNRQSAMRIIETAINNEEALDIISQEARREGNRRTS